jgi:hypothetical protein
MRQFQFQVHGLTEDDLRRWRKFTRQFVWPTGVLAWVVVGIVIFFALRWVPMGVFDVGVFKGRNLMVVVDNSSSMTDNKDRQARLKTQREQLKAAGVAINRDLTSIGFGLSPSGAATNLLYSLRQELSENPPLDTIYFFSDFDPGTYGIGPNDLCDQAGYEELRGMLWKYRLRLYLSTVAEKPSAEFVALARESGGGVVNSR